MHSITIALLFLLSLLSPTAIRVLLVQKATAAIYSYEGLSYTTSISYSYHTPFGIIDLTNLNRVEVDYSSATAWVEAGATVGEIYYNVAVKSNGTLGFTAGSCATVGSGGHISGGGFGVLSRKYGLAADNVRT
ncbi:berberine bridge enzyme [Carex littledalei]|uniref:Berberine bridge enzyme n=1 Tax=Carex littledalei TaxID=544730 RepID=A0A833VGF0_9POAL|nr:berberine bridge enzyme [Carex littledalei]